MATPPDWRSCANRHLLAHVLNQARKGIYYCHPDDTARGPSNFPHPLTVKLSQVLTAHAHCWSLDMADWPSGPPTAAEQREAWGKAMEDADKECRKVRDQVLTTE